MDLIAKLQHLANVIGATQEHLPTVNESNDTGFLYVLVDGTGFRLCARDRDLVIRDEFVADINELLYLIFEDVTWRMAVEYEKAHRIPHQDFRRALFSYQLTLLAQLDRSWAERRSAAIRNNLNDQPFKDK